MSTRTPLALLALLALAPGCRRDEAPPTAPAAAPDALPPIEPDAAPPPLPDAGSPPTPEPPLPGGTARLRFEPTAPLGMGNQLHPLYRPLGMTGSQRRKGTFYLELCSTPDCPVPRRVRVNDAVFGPYGSVNGPRGKALTVGGLPGRAAPWHARLVLDTAFSRGVGDSVDATGRPGPFDVYASGGGPGGGDCATAQNCAGGAIRDGRNPAVATFEITLRNGQTTDLGRVVFGHLVAALDLPEPPPGAGRVLVAATGTGGRDAIYAIDERDRQVSAPAIATLGGRPYPGELCGFVRGAGRDLWVLGAGKDGHVFRYDVVEGRFVDPPTAIAPPRRGGRVSLCEGVYLRTPRRAFLVLVERLGAGVSGAVEGWPMAVVDVTDPAAPVARVIAPDAPPFAGDGGASPALRRVATDGRHVFALAPAWRTGGGGSTALYAFALDPETGAPTLRHTVHAFYRDGQCDGGLRLPPALTVAPMGGRPHVFVGVDEGLDLFDAEALATGQTRGPVGRVDTRDYGRLPTSVALAPDRQRLYVMPSCKSAARAVLGGAPATRHAVAIVDLTSDPARPALLHTDRRFDDPGGGPTGGVDLAWLSLARAVQRYAPQAALPPIAYTAPELVAGSTALYLRGAGVRVDGGKAAEIRAAGVSGLGQAGDVAVFDLATGQGTLSRPGYRLLFEGPSAAWGVDLRPGDRGAATGAMIRLAR